MSDFYFRDDSKKGRTREQSRHALFFAKVFEHCENICRVLIFTPVLSPFVQAEDISFRIFEPHGLQGAHGRNALYGFKIAIVLWITKFQTAVRLVE